MAKNVTNVNISGPSIAELNVVAKDVDGSNLDFNENTKLIDIKSIYLFIMALEDKYNIGISDEWITSPTALIKDLQEEVTRLIKQPW